MSRRVLLLYTLVFLGSASLTRGVLAVIAQNQVQVGTPKCETYNSNSDPPTPCSRVRCAPEPDSFSNYASCTPDYASQDKLLCQNVPSGCQVDRQVACSSIDAKSISYAYSCDDGRNGDFVQTIVCPLTCTKTTATPTPTPVPTPTPRTCDPVEQL